MCVKVESTKSARRKRASKGRRKRETERQRGVIVSQTTEVIDLLASTGHTLTHTHKHTHTHTHTHACTHTNTHTPAFTHAHTHTHSWKYSKNEVKVKSDIGVCIFVILSNMCSDQLAPHA